MAMQKNPLFSLGRQEKNGPITNSFYNDYVFSEEQTVLLRAYYKILKKPENEGGIEKSSDLNEKQTKPKEDKQ